MDSVTQILLGASVGEAVMGRKVGRKAALWGAVCGTLPDLDVLVPFSDPVATFTYHRSFSHSLITLALLTPLMVWLIRKIHPAHAHHRKGWITLVYLAFATHVLLDACTIYGTQIFWPVVSTPMTWGSVFIIDPLFSLPLLVGLLAVLILRERPEKAWQINAAMLVLSTLYLGWSFAGKNIAHRQAEAALAQQGVEYRDLLTVASPFNTLMWRFVVMTDQGYEEGWYSFLAPNQEISFSRHDSQPELLESLDESWPVQRLRWFTKGFFRVRREGDDIVMADLRMGAESFYVFQFKVGEIRKSRVFPIATVQLEDAPEPGSFQTLWNLMLGKADPMSGPTGL